MHIDTAAAFAESPRLELFRLAVDDRCRCVMGALATVPIVRTNTVNAGMTRIGGRPKLEDLGKTNRRPKTRGAPKLQDFLEVF